MTSTAVPSGLWPGPDETFYGPMKAVPDGWQYRTCEDLDWFVAPDRRWVPESVVQCRPAPNRTERVPWHEAYGRIAFTPGGEQARVVKVVRDARASVYAWIWTDPDGPGNGGGIGFPAFDTTVEVLVED